MLKVGPKPTNLLQTLYIVYASIKQVTRIKIKTWIIVKVHDVHYRQHNNENVYNVKKLSESMTILLRVHAISMFTE